MCFALLWVTGTCRHTTSSRDGSSCKGSPREGSSAGRYSKEPKGVPRMRSNTALGQGWGDWGPRGWLRMGYHTQHGEIQWQKGTPGRMMKEDSWRTRGWCWGTRGAWLETEGWWATLRCHPWGWDAYLKTPCGSWNFVQQDKTSKVTFFSMERIRTLSRPHGRPRVRSGKGHWSYGVPGKHYWVLKNFCGIRIFILIRVKTLR